MALGRLLFTVIKYSNISQQDFLFSLAKVYTGEKKIPEITLVTIKPNDFSSIDVLCFYLIGKHDIRKNQLLEFKGEGFFVNGIPVIYSY